MEYCNDDESGVNKPLTLDNSLAENPDISYKPQNAPYPYASPYAKAAVPFPFARHYPDDDDDSAFLLKQNDCSSTDDEDAYKDRFFALAFIGHLLFITFLAFTFGVPNIRYFNLTPGSATGDHQSQGLSIIFIFFTAALIGSVGSAIWLLVLQKYASRIISSTFLCGIIAFLIGGVLCVVKAGSGGALTGILLFAFAIVNSVYYLCVRNRIPFAAANLTISTTIIRRFPEIAYCGFGALMVQFMWISLWSIAMLGVWAKLAGNLHGTNVSANICIILLLTSLFWGLHVIRNVVHCVAAGTVGDWWYNVTPVSTVMRSLKRSLTTSFGSICYGSLVVAFLHSVKVFLSVLKRKRARRVNACLEMFVGFVERTVQYLNKYAFCQVALYGKDFKSAGLQTMALFRERGWTTIVNDDLISGVLSVGCLIVGSLTGVLGGAMIYSTVHCSTDVESAECDTLLIVLMTFVTCMIIGFSMCAVVSSIVESTIATVFVCFAQDPAALQLTNPTQFNAIIDAWQRHHPNEMAQSGPAYASISV